MDLLDRMLGHDAWATGVLFETCGGLSNSQLRQQFDIGQGCVFMTMSHLVEAIDLQVSQIKDRER